MTQRHTDNRRSCSQRYWRAHVTAQSKSGLTRAEYCRQHKLSYHALTYWHRKLSQACRNKVQLVPVAMEQYKNSRPEGTLYKVILPDQVAVEVPDNFDQVTLATDKATFFCKFDILSSLFFVLSFRSVG